MSLEHLCLRIIGNDERALIELFNDDRIVKLIHSAVNRILKKNHDQNKSDLVSLAQTIVWREIFNHYVPARNKDKADHLVVRFISSRLYGRLLNEIKLVKELSDTNQGLKSKADKVSLDAKTDDDLSIAETIGDPGSDMLESMIADADLERLNKTIQKALAESRITLVDLIMFQLRFQLDFSILRICEVIQAQFALKYSQSKVRKNINKVNTSIREMLWKS